VFRFEGVMVSPMLRRRSERTDLGEEVADAIQEFGQFFEERID
jgi:hypothetical protein